MCLLLHVNTVLFILNSGSVVVPHCHEHQDLNPGVCSSMSLMPQHSAQKSHFYLINIQLQSIFVSVSLQQQEQFQRDQMIDFTFIERLHHFSLRIFQPDGIAKYD